MNNTTLQDPSGDVMEVEGHDGGAYISIEQDGRLATAGPFSVDELRAIFNVED